jgi:hypothetical protein
MADIQYTPKKVSELPEAINTDGFWIFGSKTVNGVLTSVKFAFNNIISLFGVTSGRGNSETLVMSQKSVTQELTGLENQVSGAIGQVTEIISGIISEVNGVVENGINEINAAASIENLYNVTVQIPLSGGQFYTPDAARASIPDAIRKLGMIITYQTGTETWKTEQFIGNDITDWAIETNWRAIAGIGSDEESEEETGVEGQLNWIFNEAGYIRTNGEMPWDAAGDQEMKIYEVLPGKTYHIHAALLGFSQPDSFYSASIIASAEFVPRVESSLNIYNLLYRAPDQDINFKSVVVDIDVIIPAGCYYLYVSNVKKLKTEWTGSTLSEPVVTGEIPYFERKVKDGHLTRVLQIHKPGISLNPAGRNIIFWSNFSSITYKVMPGSYYICPRPHLRNSDVIIASKVNDFSYNANVENFAIVGAGKEGTPETGKMIIYIPEGYGYLGLVFDAHSESKAYWQNFTELLRIDDNDSRIPQRSKLLPEKPYRWGVKFVEIIYK